MCRQAALETYDGYAAARVPRAHSATRRTRDAVGADHPTLVVRTWRDFVGAFEHVAAAGRRRVPVRATGVPGASHGRRQFLGALFASLAAGLRIRGERRMMIAFSNRAHLAVLPQVKEQLARCLTTIFGCPDPVRLNAPGLSEPILAFRFPGGGSMSFEFRPDALAESDVMRGAWLEVKTDDVKGLRRAIAEAGLRQVHHPTTDTFYCALPGGQVLGIVAAS